MKYLRVARKFLKAGASDAADASISRQREAFVAANLLVRVYYAVTLYLLASRLDLWSNWLASKEISPLWPVAWVQLVGISTAVHFIMLGSLVAALLGSLFPDKRVFRSLLFVMLLEYVAFSNSFGKIGHEWHSWLGISFFFIFLPDGKGAQMERLITRRQLYLTVFWGAQALVLWYYSLSGFWKVILGGYQFLKGDVHTFSPDALAYQVTNHLLQTNSTSMIGSFIVEHAVVGWSLYLGAVYLELFAFVVAFRPSLHRVWGVSLICFHFGSQFALSIGFPTNVLLLALFFVGSPFSPPKNSWRAVSCDLPLIGWGAKRFGVLTAAEEALAQARAPS